MYLNYWPSLWPRAPDVNNMVKLKVIIAIMKAAIWRKLCSAMTSHPVYGSLAAPLKFSLCKVEFDCQKQLEQTNIIITTQFMSSIIMKVFYCKVEMDLWVLSLVTFSSNLQLVACWLRVNHKFNQLHFGMMQFSTCCIFGLTESATTVPNVGCLQFWGCTLLLSYGQNQCSANISNSHKLSHQIKQLSAI